MDLDRLEEFEQVKKRIRGLVGGEITQTEPKHSHGICGAIKEETLSANDRVNDRYKKTLKSNR